MGVIWYRVWLCVSVLSAGHTGCCVCVRVDVGGVAGFANGGAPSSNGSALAAPSPAFFQNVYTAVAWSVHTR